MNVNTDIAITHIVTRKKQTIVAALGVTLGIGIFLFMNSLSSGFSKFSRDEIFKNSAHIKIYKSEEITKPLVNTGESSGQRIIINPHILEESKMLINPQHIMALVKAEPFVKNVLPQVNVDVFYYNGNSYMRGTANGMDILNADAMFNIKKYIVAGKLEDLQGNRNAIILGKVIADKLNLRPGDQVTVKSGQGVSKNLTIKAIYFSGNTMTDQSKSYVNLSTAQQLSAQNSSYVTTIYVNTLNPDKAAEFAANLQRLTTYTVEPWQVTNADMLSSDVVRGTLMRSISFSILIVAAFGIYNILNMTVMQKINDIAILKAVGFSGRDVIRIFVTEAIVMGLIGSIVGLGLGALLVAIVKNIYMGPPVGNFPVDFELNLFLASLALGIVVTFFAGFFPAKKAANIDPVEIFRK
jgi:lipoprotein-releasing system permease protein